MSSVSIAELAAAREVRFGARRVDLLAPDGIAFAEALGAHRALVVVSSTVNRLYGGVLRHALGEAGSDEPLFVLPTGEPNKNLGSVALLLNEAERRGLGRRGVVVSIGGGVLLDTAGVAASLFRRGVPHLKIGTTLLAQVDASIGVKCGVNLGSSKNIVGSFYPSAGVLVDGAFLKTLPQRHIRSGLAEMVKLAVICDRDLFHGLEVDGVLFLGADRDAHAARSLVDASIKGMIGELQPNPYEHELRRRVDFGHTLSPLLESETRYSLLHGEAVAVDVAFFCVVSQLLGLLDEDDLLRVASLLRQLGLAGHHPLLHADGFIERGLQAAQAHRGGQLHQPLPTALGSSVFVNDASGMPATLLASAAAATSVLFDSLTRRAS